MRKLDPAKLKPEWFVNKASYNAAVFGIACINNIIQKKKEGCMILQYEKFERVQFVMNISPSCGSVAFTHVDNEWQSTHNIFGMAYKFGKIHCTKRNIREYFKLWRIVRIAEVTKAYAI